MSKKKKFEELSDKIVDLVGGKDNVSFLTHCVTRLRFNLKDKSLAQISEIEKLWELLECSGQENSFR